MIQPIGSYLLIPSKKLCEMPSLILSRAFAVNEIRIVNLHKYRVRVFSGSNLSSLVSVDGSKRLEHVYIEMERVGGRSLAGFQRSYFRPPWPLGKLHSSSTC